MSVLRNSSATCAKGTAGSVTFIRFTSPVMIMLPGFMGSLVETVSAHTIGFPDGSHCRKRRLVRPHCRPTIPCEQRENHSFCERHRCRGNLQNEMQSFPEGGVFPGRCREHDEPQCVGGRSTPVRSHRVGAAAITFGRGRPVR